MDQDGRAPIVGPAQVSIRLLDLGPDGGVRGGEIVAQGTLQDILDSEESLTGKYLSGRLRIEVPGVRR